MDALVSVIIPLYNMGPYLTYSVHSVRTQTYRNLEIILIDDGSQDNTLSLCHSIAKNDDRVKVIHKLNGGVSSARNAGLDAAQGEYIVFVDGDDIVDFCYVEKLVSAVQGKALSMCMHIRVDDYGFQFRDSHEKFKVLSTEECAKRLIEGKFPVCVWGGGFRKSKIGKLRFPVGIKNNEDKFFLYSYLLNNPDSEVAFSNQEMYGYYVREGSSTRSDWNGSRDTIEMADRMHELTMYNHPEWSEKSQANRIAARIDTLKAIVLSNKKDLNSKKEFRSIKKEVLSIPLPDSVGKTLRVSYIALRSSDLVFRLLVKGYYGLMTDRMRFKRNENLVRQK